MIIVTGVGRCGTSLMIKFLQKCGLSIGSDKWFDTVNAGLENKHTLNINQNLIKHFVKGEEVNLYHVKGEILDLPYDAVKDPQFLTDTRLIETWWDVRQDIEVIMMTRDPLEIVESVYRKPEWNTPVYRTRVDLIKKKEKEFTQKLKELNIPWVRYQYPHLIGSQIIEDLEEHLPENSQEIWEETFII